MSINNVYLTLAVIKACSEPKRIPTAEDVLNEMDNEWKLDNRGGPIKYILGNPVFPAVEKGDHYISPKNIEKGDHYISPKKTGSSTVEISYGSYDEAIKILQHAILVMIEQDLKTDDPIKKQKLLDGKKNLLEHLGVFGSTTSVYLKMIHTEAGLYQIPSVTKDVTGKPEKSEIEKAIETMKGKPIYNYLTVAILKKALEAVRDKKSWRGAVEGMFDTRAKIEKFHNEEHINGSYKITLEEEKHYKWVYYDVLVKGKKVPLPPKK